MKPTVAGLKVQQVWQDESAGMIHGLGLRHHLEKKFLRKGVLQSTMPQLLGLRCVKQNICLTKVLITIKRTAIYLL